MIVKKIISSLLIFCVLLQLLFIDAGCKSFYPVEGINNLTRFYYCEDNILLKLDDNSSLQITPKKFFFVEKPADLVYGTGNVYDYKTKIFSGYTGVVRKEMMDSIQTVKTEDEIYHFYWTKDSKKYIFEDENSITITPDSGKYFWVVIDEFTGKFRKINNGAIREIQVNKTNWVKTSGLIVAAGVSALLYFFISLGSELSSIQICI